MVKASERTGGRTWDDRPLSGALVEDAAFFNDLSLEQILQDESTFQSSTLAMLLC